MKLSKDSAVEVREMNLSPAHNSWSLKLVEQVEGHNGVCRVLGWKARLNSCVVFFS